jgi:hypothetical protein
MAYPDFLWPDQVPMILLALPIPDAFDGAIVLAYWLVVDHAHPPACLRDKGRSQIVEKKGKQAFKKK